MDTAWIEVFVLTLSECVAPAGKTVCQEQQVQYQFFDRQECESVLQQLVDYSASSDNVIVNEQQSHCLPTAKEQRVFQSLDEANEQLADLQGWGRLQPLGEARQPLQTGDMDPEYRQRLQSLPECDDQNRSPPCKVGPIIVESAPDDETEELEVWRRDQTGND